MAAVQVRYIVDDVDEAIAFYCATSDFGKRCTRTTTSRCWLGRSFGWF